MLVFIFITFFIKVKWWLVLGVALTTTLFLASSIFAWNQLLGNYQRERVLTFIEGPEADPLGSGYQIIQSKIAIGSGQLFGRGFLQGTQSSLHILTQAHTDFAFASWSEQFGFVGALLLLSTYLILLLRILKIAKETKSDFGRNLAFGVVGLFLIHIFINIGMNLGKLPVTGIPLPLVSYGGSSVLMTLIVLGLMQSVHASRRPVDMADSLMLTSLAGNKSE
jgi:rod shape determining protein RodA